MNRKELVKSPEYWTTQIQLDLFELIENYCKKNNLSKTELAAQLGVTKGYVSQILNGDFDHKMSKLVELSLACGKVPVLQFIDIDNYIKKDKNIAPDSLQKESRLLHCKKSNSNMNGIKNENGSRKIASAEI